MQLKHDREADAIYAYLSQMPYAYGVDLDNERRIDYSADGIPVGVELLCVSNGVNLTGLPDAGELASQLLALGMKVYRLDELPAGEAYGWGQRLIFAAVGDGIANITEVQRLPGLFSVDLPCGPQPAGPNVRMRPREVVA